MLDVHETKHGYILDKIGEFSNFFHESIDGWFLLKVLSCRCRSTTRTEASKSEPKTKTVKEGRSQSVGREGKVGLLGEISILFFCYAFHGIQNQFFVGFPKWICSVFPFPCFKTKILQQKLWPIFHHDLVRQKRYEAECSRTSGGLQLR